MTVAVDAPIVGGDPESSSAAVFAAVTGWVMDSFDCAGLFERKYQVVPPIIIMIRMRKIENPRMVSFFFSRSSLRFRSAPLL